jgi:PAS domain S-box-containing protein
MQDMFLPKYDSPEELTGLLAAIVTSSDDAIISKDLNGIVRSWNPAAARIFGYTAEEMIGCPITNLFPVDRLDEEPKILEQIRRGQRVDHFETVRRHKDGRLIDVSVTISPLRDASGQVVGVSKVARDVTSVKRVLVEREKMLQREKFARADAERLGRMKDEFLSTLSHELRTPLNAILGWATLLRAPGIFGSPSDLQEGLDTIERNARAQARLIDELLDMSRIINGKFRLDLQAVDVAQIINSAVESIRPALDAKRIRITKCLDSECGPINADPNRLQQVLWNLLANAVKFTPAGGLVHILLRRSNSQIEITVADSGQGISREFLPQLFDRFSQAETAADRRHGGLGLGLAIVKTIVEHHGGTIAASSPGVDQGATFVIALPVIAVHESLTAPGATHPEAEAQIGPLIDFPSFDGFKILVVDDERDACTVIRRVLERCNADINTASSADEAFELVRRLRPDLILSDIGMPRQDGYQFLSRVRALSHEEGGDTPAIAITAFARSDDRRRALMAGFQMHLPKPVEPAELIAVVANQFQAYRRAASRS